MTLDLLPVELLDVVCEGLDPKHLLALARTNSSISPVAQRLLYRHLSISQLARNLDAVITLATRPHLALFVRTFSITLSDKTSAFRPYYTALTRALSNMTDLTGLDILVEDSASWVLSQSLRPRPRLRHFTTSFSLDSHLVTFLDRTPALEELKLESSAPQPGELPSTSIPRLVSFVGPSQAAMLVVPGRPVQSIHIFDAGLTEDEVACLAKSTAPVAILDAKSSTLVPPLLLSIAQHLPKLACLRLSVPSDTQQTSDDFPQQLDHTFYEEISGALTMMPQLTDFELSGMHWASFPVHDKGSKRVWQSPSFTPISPVVPPRNEYLEHFSDFGFDDFAFSF